jgi:hypothetical protein
MDIMYPYNLKLLLGVSKKQKNRENQKKKNNWKNWTVRKPIKILKKPTGSIRFYKPETEKNWTKSKPEKNRAKLKNQAHTGLNQFLS